ncbi:MAG: hypothetical protein D6797_03485 [Bdellovibrio sp.]|nr:MAG: hypothetical protein D6797_03485 [Bdellovibrio sp.]
MFFFLYYPPFLSSLFLSFVFYLSSPVNFFDTTTNEWPHRASLLFFSLFVFFISATNWPIFCIKSTLMKRFFHLLSFITLTFSLPSHAVDRSYMERYPYIDPYQFYELNLQRLPEKEGKRLPFEQLFFIRSRDTLGKVQFPVKTPEEVHRWMKCFTPKKYFSSKFSDETYVNYIPYIQQAAKSFHLPYAFLACKLWQESKWNRKAKSHANALGLAQFKPSTAYEINSVFRSKTDIKKLSRQVNELILLKNKFIKYRGIKGWQKDLRLATRLLRNAHRKNLLSPKWRHYINAVKSLKGPFKVYPQVLSEKRFCQNKSCSKWEFFNPIWSIGAAATYLQDLIYRLDINYYFGREDEKGLPRSMEGFFYEQFSYDGPEVQTLQLGDNINILDFLVLTTAAYNAGLGYYVTELQQTSDSTQDWLSYAKNKNQESYNHMRKLRACMLAGNFTHPTDYPVVKDPLCKKAK